jgi:hypothetical protein
MHVMITLFCDVAPCSQKDTHVSEESANSVFISKEPAASISVESTQQNYPGYVSQYSDWLQAGWPRDRNSILSKGKDFFFFTACRKALGLIQPPIQRVRQALPLG